MLLKIATIGLAIYMTIVMGVVVVLQQTGVFVLSVQDKTKNRNLFIPVPMLMVNGALHLLPEAKFHFARDRMDDEKLEWLMAATEELANCPDANFVEVQTAREQVLVAKRGANFLVDVNTPDKNVHLSIPIHATRKAIAQIFSE
jgi:hypothetical protein